MDQLTRPSLLEDIQLTTRLPNATHSSLRTEALGKHQEDQGAVREHNSGQGKLLLSSLFVNKSSTV